VGKLPAAELAKPYSLKWPQTVPQELSPFIESLSLPTLAQVLDEAPHLYWHPYVYRQLVYLLRLRRDAEAWERLGWEWAVDEESGEVRRPTEVDAVCEALERLVEAHVRGLLPDRQLVRVQAPKKPGPKTRFENPHPVGPGAEWVDVATLYRDERVLRQIFSAKRRDLEVRHSRGKDRQAAKARIEQLVYQVLEQSHAAAWSDAWWEYETIDDDRPEPPLPPPDASQAEWWEHLTQVPVPRIIRRWRPLPFGDALDRMLLLRKMGRAGRDGKPAYPAYAVLGALLEKSPEVMMHALDNYRYPRHGRLKP
jgi:hypothetical protein